MSVPRGYWVNKLGMPPREFAKRSGLKLCTLYARLQAGKTPEEILATPLKVSGVSFDGRVFGRLTVVGEAEKRTVAGKRRFLCRCECGQEKVVIGADLESGRTVSCGCWFAEKASVRQLARIEDITGQRFGRLVVVGPSGRKVETKNGKARIRLWLCRCDCGETCEARAQNLKFGNTMSCGCKRRENDVAAGDRMRERAVRVEVFGETVTLDELADLTDLTKEAIRDRLKRGMAPEEAAFKPRMHQRDRKRRAPTVHIQDSDNEHDAWGVW